MRTRWLIVGLSMVALATIDTSHAAPKKGARQTVRHAPASVAPRYSSEQARMYEARPGVWISTYDCLTDDGYGRWRRCSDSGGRGGM